MKPTGYAIVGAVALAAGSLASAAVAQDCSQAQALLRQGQTVLQTARQTGLSSAQVEACRRAIQQRRLMSPEGPPPLGAAGPAPHGAAGPPPLGAAGPAPHGAAGPAPHGAAGPAPHGAAGPAPFGEP